MLKTLKALVPKSDKLPDRAYTLTWRRKFLDTSIYDLLPHEFYEEKNSSNEYVPLKDRAPSVRYGLPAIIVSDTTSLLFDEDHFPAIELGDDDSEAQLSRVFKSCNLRMHMQNAAECGSVGSVGVLLRQLEGRLFVEVMDTTYLTPFWKKKAPDTLEKVVEKYIVRGHELIEIGYQIDKKDKDRDFWFQRDFTEQEEVWYLPWPVSRTVEEEKLSKYDAMQRDEKRTVKHDLGFVPVEWIKNLPGGDETDGRCTFELGLPISVEIDYLLSQGGRGLKYASDPTLHIKEPGYQNPEGGEGEPLVKGAANAIVTGPESDVRLLEINGSANAAVLAHVEKLRELALELCSGSRASPDKLSTAQSGRAMELMNQNLIWLASKLRTTYGETALARIVKKISKINARSPIKIEDEDEVPVGAIKAKKVNLKWPPWYAPTATDHQAMSVAIAGYRDAGIISRKTAVRQISHDFDIDDPDQEIRDIDADREADIKLQLKANPPQQGAPQN